MQAKYRWVVSAVAYASYHFSTEKGSSILCSLVIFDII